MAYGQEHGVLVGADGVLWDGETVPLRSLHARLEPREFARVSRAVQLVAWDRDHRFCGRCATPTEVLPAEHVRRCPSCGLLAYPRIAPAVIVLVERGDRVLLARSPTFPQPFFSTLAGFVEPGETFEEAVAREVEEEVGLVVRDAR